MKRVLTGDAAGRGISKVFALTLALLLVALAAGCSKSANTTNTTNGSTTSNSGSTTTPPTTRSSSSGQSPTEVIKAYYDAAQKKDWVALKSYLSQGTLEMMEEGAKKQGKTVDEALKDAPSQAILPQLGAETINGDTATVEMTAEGQKVNMPLVKEGGAWKLALDKLIKETLGGMNNASPGASPADGDDDHGGGH